MYVEGSSVRPWGEDVCIWKGSSVRAWGRGRVCAYGRVWVEREGVYMEGVECACMGRVGCVYGKGGECMHGEREGVYMEGVECAWTRRGCVYGRF